MVISDKPPKRENKLLLVLLALTVGLAPLGVFMIYSVWPFGACLAVGALIIIPFIFILAKRGQIKI